MISDLLYIPLCVMDKWTSEVWHQIAVVVYVKSFLHKHCSGSCDHGPILLTKCIKKAARFINMV